ncbi:MAG: AAA family ATPase, partial [Brooklawnia sp.]
MTNKSVYIAAPEGRVGKSIIALGLIEALSRQVKSVGIFRPMVSDDHDEVAIALLAHTGIDQTYDEAVGLITAEAVTDPERALTQIIEQYG